MATPVALDSNALTYLLDAVGSGYLPEADFDEIAPERLAMFRIFCYSDRPLWVPPTVRREYERISDPVRRQTHDRWARYQLEDGEPPLAAGALRRRALELNRQHQGFDDCRIVAETEAASAGALLTSDGDLIGHLDRATTVAIVRPSDFLESLRIEPGAAPRTWPTVGNPLRNQKWWRL